MSSSQNNGVRPAKVLDSLLFFVLMLIIIQSLFGGFELNLILFTFSMKSPANPLILLNLLALARIIGFLTGKIRVPFPSIISIEESEDRDTRSLFKAVFFTSVSILMLEILLTRIFSVILFYHFAFMAVSVAIFGGALSGVIVYIFPKFFTKTRVRLHLGITMLLMSVSTILAVVILLQLRIGYVYSSLNIKRLVFAYLLALVPFFFGGMGITLSFTHFTEKISRLYFSDLLGAGIGCFLIIPLLNMIDAPSATFIVAAVALLAGFYYLSTTGKKKLKTALLLLAVGLYAFGIVNSNAKLLYIKYSKDKQNEEEKVLLDKWNSFSRVAVMDTSMADWSLSWNYTGETAENKNMNIDALAGTAITKFDGNLENYSYLKWELTYTGLIFGKNEKVFIIGPGGGRDIIASLVSGAEEVDAAEINPIIVNDVMNGKFQEYSGNIYNHPGVDVVMNDARSAIRSRDERYDVIMMSLVDTWAASSAGAYNLSENNLYTVEAMTDFYTHLKDDGVLSIERWESEALRLLAVAEEMAERENIENIEKHIIVVGKGNLHNFLLKKSPWTPEDIARLNAWAGPRGFWVLYDPINIYDHDYGKFFAENKEKRELFRNNYLYLLTPSTDNQPFFFQKEKPLSFAGFIKKSLRKGTFFKGSLLFKKGISGLQYFIVILGALVFLVIIIPLIIAGRKVIKEKFLSKTSHLIYFAFLGLGFILIEVALMQKFILFLGHPIYSFSVVLFSILIFGGLGSRFTARWKEEEAPSRILKVIPLLIALSVVYLFALSPLFYSLIKVPAFGRVIISVVLLAPFAFMMGMPMPLGLKELNRKFHGLVPWAWAINGSFSVLGSALSVYYAIRFGFATAQIIGIGFYAVAMLSAGTWMLKKKGN